MSTPPTNKAREAADASIVAQLASTLDTEAQAADRLAERLRITLDRLQAEKLAHLETRDKLDAARGELDRERLGRHLLRLLRAGANYTMDTEAQRITIREPSGTVSWGWTSVDQLATTLEGWLVDHADEAPGVH